MNKFGSLDFSGEDSSSGKDCEQNNKLLGLAANNPLGGGGSSTTKGESVEANTNPFLGAEDTKSDHSGGYLQRFTNYSVG